jgi:hypothetical protein
MGDCRICGGEGCLAEKLGGCQEGCDVYEPYIGEEVDE